MAVQVEQRKKSRFRVGPICTYPYPAHIHDAVEIAVVRRGYVSMTVNGTSYTMEPDTAMIVFPGMAHSYDSASEDADGLFIGFVPDLIEEFRNTLVTMWPVVPMVKMAECPADVETAVGKLEEYSGRDGSFPLMLPYIHLLTACLFTKLDLVPSEEQNKDDFLYKVLNYVRQHSGEDLTLDSVAREIGVGRSHLSHLFSQKMKINFRRFLNKIRIEKACKLLQDSQISIKEICYECGFDNTRTFHRVFLEEQKMTPGEFREKMRNRWANPLESNNSQL